MTKLKEKLKEYRTLLVWFVAQAVILGMVVSLAAIFSDEAHIIARPVIGLLVSP